MSNKIPQRPLALISLDVNAHNVPTTYDSSAGSLLSNALEQSHSRFLFINNTTGDIAISLDNSTDHFVCPAGSPLEVDEVRIDPNFAVRSLTGSAITDAVKCYLSVW